MSAIENLIKSRLEERAIEILLDVLYVSKSGEGRSDAPHVQARLTSAKRRVIQPLHLEFIASTMTDVWSGEILLPDGASIKGNDASVSTRNMLICVRHWVLDFTRHLCTGNNRAFSAISLDRRYREDTLVSCCRAQL